MILLIPLGGKGERFKNAGYKKSKALIEISGRPIICWLLDNLKYTNDIDFIYIPYSKEYIGLESFLVNEYPDYKFKFFPLEKETRGAAETIYLSLQNLISQYIRYPISYDDLKKSNDRPILCLDSDNFYTNDIISLWNKKNCVFVFNDTQPKPIFSYIKYDDEKLLDIVEKNKISDCACTGAYGFESFFELSDYCFKIIQEDIRSGGEFYTSVVIKTMLNDNKKFTYREILNKDYFSLGTPEQVKNFEFSFLFDLDGTLVNTDKIYIEVWKSLLVEYDLLIDESFFNNFIKGRSDVSFLKFLIPAITDEKINEISQAKDRNFINLLSNLEEPILLGNIISFFEKIKNRRIAIVTSCNKLSAEYIIKKTGLYKYVNLLITADDCINHKPNPEPYEKAINYLGLNKKKCIIFEDSISGYISGKNTDVYKVCVIDNENSSEDIKNLDTFKYNDYDSLSIKDILSNDLLNKNHKYSKLIEEKLSYLPIKKVCYNNKNLKTGYICDIDSYKLIYTNGNKQDIILKISNTNNELSKTAVKLNMYKNEAYFYEKISDLITMIKIPKNYGIINTEDRIGILLEDLFKYSGKFDIDLNNNINILLKVVDDLYKIHHTFYYNSEEEVINIMKPLKTVKEITYYAGLVNQRFDKFIEKSSIFIGERNLKNLININKNFSKILNLLSKFPLSFCHGDVKSPNIFYKNDMEPYFLDWQYIHLNKGVSDLVFLLVESIKFDVNLVTIVEKYYYRLLIESGLDYDYNTYLLEFKASLCMFPFFVCVWFNSEDSEKLLDKVFPMRFMKNLLLYYDYYLDDDFFSSL